jgi:hypothetical protein
MLWAKLFFKNDQRAAVESFSFVYTIEIEQRKLSAHRKKLRGG